MTSEITTIPTPAAHAQARGEGHPYVTNLRIGTRAPQSATPIKYTVIIPSRNRQRYAVEAARSVLLSGRDDVQVIVADNSDDESVMPRLLEAAGVLDQVLLLEAEDEALVMKYNWERALDYAAGEWISYIGDDDGYMLDGFDTLDYLTTVFKSRAFSWKPIYYKWPCFPECDRSMLTVMYEDTGVVFSATMQTLESHIDWITTDKWPAAGPSIYHGIIHRDVINATRVRYGRYFLNAIVDYSSAITNCTFFDQFVAYSGPVTVMGACGNSNTAGLTAAGTGKVKIEQLRAENPDFSAVYPSFRESRLMAVWVIAGYAKLLEEIGLPFNMTPGKFSKSLIQELGRVRDSDVFAEEHARLRAFMVEHGLDTTKVDAMKCVPTMKPQGLYLNPTRMLADTAAFGWTGIVDVVSNLNSLRADFRCLVSVHGELIEKTRKLNPVMLNENADDAYKILGRMATEHMADIEGFAIVQNPKLTIEGPKAKAAEDAVVLETEPGEQAETAAA